MSLVRIDIQRAAELHGQGSSLRAIAAVLGCSPGGVFNALRKAGIQTARPLLIISCHRCGKSFHRRRSYVEGRIRTFCSDACYFAELHNPNFVQHRRSQYKARKIVSRHFRLLPGHIVHHVDSNERNNELENLWVFQTASDHGAYERGRLDVQPIWRGTDVLAYWSSIAERTTGKTV